MVGLNLASALGNLLSPRKLSQVSIGWAKFGIISCNVCAKYEGWFVGPALGFALQLAKSSYIGRAKRGIFRQKFYRGFQSYIFYILWLA